MVTRASLALILFCGVSISVAKQNPDLVFNGNGKVVLALSKPMKLEILKKDSKNKVVTQAKFNLPDATKAETKGRQEGDKFFLDINYKEEIKGEGSAKLTKAELMCEILNNVSTGYWALKSLTISYQGQIDDSTPITGTDNPYDVDSNPGKTAKQADNIFGRGYLTGAPKNLCWACDNQVFNAKDESTRLTMPGSRLQPVFGGNATFDHVLSSLDSRTDATKNAFRFGYEWDCDPLIPLAVWVGILLTLVLVSFLYWAIDMLVSLQTPNRFDDPRGKPLNVPTTD